MDLWNSICFQNFIAIGWPLLQMYPYLMCILNITNQLQYRLMTSRQNAPCRYIEFEFWLADRPFVLSSTLLAGLQLKFMLRLSCSVDPSLTHTYSAFPAEGLGTKLKSCHHRQFFFNQQRNVPCTVALTDHMDLRQ